MKKFLIITLLFLFLPLFIFAENENSKIKVGTIIRPPFVTQNNFKLQGFSIDLWKKIAEKNNFQYEFKIFENFKDMLSAVENNKIDLALSNISVTNERKNKILFSHSYFNSGIIVLIPKYGAGPTIWELIKSSWPIKLLIILILIFLLATHLIWLKDKRNYSNNFRNSYFGILDAGDWLLHYIFGKKGRWFIFWFIIITGIITSVYFTKWKNDLNVNNLKHKIKSVSDLDFVKLGVPEKTTMEKFAKKNKLNYVKYSDFSKALDGLEKLEVEAILGDASTSLNYYATELSQKKIISVGTVFEKDNVAIAVSKNKKKLLDKIDDTLVELSDEGIYLKIKNKYFKK